ncbi:hypothetical protein [Methylobacterium brachythecii]|uniref:Uncharacterized protein n=1 Tax=Methylobacterium brachythecii TaxID=1176177 RepID=A0A7W6AI43_9HYPH|nr:hypothetical protein [Methylobacterium brachythecii]MBB3902019.1 hypothetical protein [Methylobacterium brachythecii]GLS46475.1 hypothetical protein GCM10007884_44690 [Methylobacterium brachythecii]
MIDFVFDEPLAILAEAFGHEPNGDALSRYDGETAPPMPIAAAVFTATRAEVVISADQAE